MDNLEKFLRENRTELKDEQMLGGDAERFAEKYERIHRIRFVSPLKRKRFPFWRAVSIPVIGSLALIAVTYFIFNSGPFKEVPVTSSSLYTHYYEEAKTLVREISLLTDGMSRDDAREFDETVSSILYEPVSILDLLPEEMGEEKRMEVVNYYTAVQLNALEECRDRMVQYLSSQEE